MDNQKEILETVEKIQKLKKFKDFLKNYQPKPANNLIEPYGQYRSSSAPYADEFFMQDVCPNEAKNFIGRVNNFQKQIDINYYSSLCLKYRKLNLELFLCFFLKPSVSKSQTQLLKVLDPDQKIKGHDLQLVFGNFFRPKFDLFFYDGKKNVKNQLESLQKTQKTNKYKSLLQIYKEMGEEDIIIHDSKSSSYEIFDRQYHIGRYCIFFNFSIKTTHLISDVVDQLDQEIRKLKFFKLLLGEKNHLEIKKYKKNFLQIFQACN